MEAQTSMKGRVVRVQWLSPLLVRTVRIGEVTKEFLGFLGINEGQKMQKKTRIAHTRGERRVKLKTWLAQGRSSELSLNY